MRGSAYPDKVRAETTGRALVVGAKQAAKEAGVPHGTVRDWMLRPEIGELRSRARDEVVERVWVGYQIALNEVVDGLTNPRTMLRDKAAALDILYKQHALMTGSATERSEARDITGTMTDVELVANLHIGERLLSGPEGTPAPAEDAPEG